MPFVYPIPNAIALVLEPLARQGIHVGDNIVMFVEDEDDELPQDGCLHEHVKHRGSLHCHRCRQIEVRVSLNGTNQRHAFAPSARIAKVREWAARVFEKDGFEGTDEMTLQLAGSTEQPQSDAHIGTLVNYPDCELAFNFIGKPLVQG